MKRIKFLAALVVAISMLFVVAAAADITVNDVEYNGTDSTITVTVEAKTAMTLDQFDCFYMTYDADVFSVGTMTSSDAKASVTDDGGVITWSNTAAATEVAVGDKILTVSFNVNATDEAVGKAFVVYEEFTMWNSNGDNADYNATITVVAGGPSIVYGAAAECAKVWTAKKDAESAYTHTFQNVAVAEAKFDAAANASEAGFAFAKDAIDATYGENKKAFDATAIAGDGSVEYTMVMYGVPYGNGVNTIFAKPYYVPAN